MLAHLAAVKEGRTVTIPNTEFKDVASQNVASKGVLCSSKTQDRGGNQIVADAKTLRCQPTKRWNLSRWPKQALWHPLALQNYVKAFQCISKLLSSGTLFETSWIYWHGLIWDSFAGQSFDLEACPAEARCTLRAPCTRHSTSGLATFVQEMNLRNETKKTSQMLDFAKLFHLVSASALWGCLDRSAARVHEGQGRFEVAALAPFRFKRITQGACRALAGHADHPELRDATFHPSRLGCSLWNSSFAPERIPV